MPDIVLNQSYPAIPANLVDDAFTRDDAAMLGQVTFTGQTWQIVGGGGAIDNERGRLVGTGNDAAAFIDAGSADVDIRTGIEGTQTTTWQPVIFRRVDGLNYWCVGINGAGSYVLQAFNDGNVSNRGASVTKFASGHRIRVVAIGTTVRVYINGVLEIEDTGAAWHQNATDHGFGHRSYGAGAPARYWHYYRVEPV